MKSTMGKKDFPTNELSKEEVSSLKGIGILFMLFLHLFCTKDPNFITFINIGGVPLIYYFALFCDAVVPIYCFSSGYGLYISNQKGGSKFAQKNLIRIFKLMLNAWIIMILFSIVSIIVGKGSEMPANATTFLKNAFLIENTYNGAWWFLQTYVILVLLSPLLIKIIDKIHPIPLILISGTIYLISYIQKVNPVIHVSNPALNSILSAVVLVGTSQIMFIVGMIFAKYKFISLIRSRFSEMRAINIWCFLIILLMIAAHGVVQSLIVAPITALGFILLFSLMKKSSFINKLLLFFADHSTNMWLIHMFFYLLLFKELVFWPRYPIFIFPWLVLLCVGTSYIINFIYRPIARLITST